MTRMPRLHPTCIDVSGANFTGNPDTAEWICGPGCPSRCSAHGTEACPNCARSLPGVKCLCSFEDDGVHWDTCPARDRSPLVTWNAEDGTRVDGRHVPPPPPPSCPTCTSGSPDYKAIPLPQWHTAAPCSDPFHYPSTVCPTCTSPNPGIQASTVLGRSCPDAFHANTPYAVNIPKEDIDQLTDPDRARNASRERPTDGKGKFIRSPDTVTREQEIVSLRLKSMTWAQIGDRMGMSAQGAHAAYRRAMQQAVEANKDDAEEMRQQEAAKLDAIERKLIEVMERDHPIMDRDGNVVGYDDRPVLAALQHLIKSSESRRKLFGTDAPARVDVSGGVSYTINGVDLNDVT